MWWRLEMHAKFFLGKGSLGVGGRIILIAILNR
jgi:hypothetical protein